MTGPRTLSLYNNYQKEHILKYVLKENNLFFFQEYGLKFTKYSRLYTWENYDRFIAEHLGMWGD